MASSTFTKLLQLLLLTASLSAPASAVHQGSLTALKWSDLDTTAAIEAAAKAGGYRKSLGFGPQHPAHLPQQHDAQALYASFVTANSADENTFVAADTASSAQQLLHKVNAHLATSPLSTFALTETSAHGNLDATALHSAQVLISALKPMSQNFVGTPPLLRGAADSSKLDWKIRKDSYTDPASGISHVYARATIGDLEIANADLNINISPSGKILSFGNSLYTSSSPSAAAVNFAAGASPAELQDGDQDGFLQSLDGKQGAGYLVDPRLALVHFLAQASPVANFARDLKEHDQSYADAIRLEQLPTEQVGFASTLDFFGASTNDKKAYKLSHVPLTTEPVKAELAYLQSPSAAGGMELQLVWKMEVEMRDNHYEAYVAALPLDQSTDEHAQEAGGRTLAVVDWVQSMPARHHDAEGQIPMLQAPHWDVTQATAEVAAKAKAAASHIAHEAEERLESGMRYLEKVYDEHTSSLESESSHRKPTKSPQQEEFAKDPLLKVFKWGYNDPTDGIRSVENGVRPHQPASPLGWHRVTAENDPFSESDGPAIASGGKGTEARKKEGKYVVYKDTRGNNVIASTDPAGAGNWRGTKRPIASRVEKKDLSDDSGEEEWIFDFPFPWRKYDKNHTELNPSTYADAATTQLFYINNEYHDLLWGYGFDEVAGNFQATNFGRGGKGNDPVIAFSQDGAGQNNADFSTPPDGSMPRMRMYTWTGTPERDGDFAEGIVIHEYSHGLSTRLTGGPANSGCLGWGEAGGFGEGQGDAFATLARRKNATVSDWTMGAWASHTKNGIRKFPYSTNMTVDPETYKTLNSPGYFGVHAIGEVWAGMVNEMAELMIAKHGFTPEIFMPLPNATQQEQDAFFLTESETPEARASKRRIPRHGNTLTIQLLVDGMKLQPCRPAFADIRDAIVQADENLTNGNNTCTIWSAFAKRGLGTDSKIELSTPWGGGIRTDGFKVPTKCKEHK